MSAADHKVRLGVAHAASPDAPCGPPGLRSLGGNRASPSRLRSVSYAGFAARATPREPALCEWASGSSLMRGILTCLLTVAAVMSSAGCGGPVRRAVAGSVTLDGQPLEEALILFVPLDAGGRKTGGPIAAGRYEMGKEVGLLPGRYRVEVADDPPINPAMRPEQGKPQPRRKLPVVYSTSSPLTVEVTADVPADFSFNLSSKPAGTP